VNTVALVGLLATQWTTPPSLAAGDRVRVHVLHQPTLLEMPLPRLERMTFGGTLTFYEPDDSLALDRDKWLFSYPSPEHVGFHFIEVYRIDVAAGSDWLRGAAKGAGYAFAATVFVSFLCTVAGGGPEAAESCPFWANFGRFSLVTVPVGALVGSRFTRWKTVYKRELTPPRTVYQWNR